MNVLVFRNRFMRVLAVVLSALLWGGQYLNRKFQLAVSSAILHDRPQAPVLSTAGRRAIEEHVPLIFIHLGHDPVYFPLYLSTAIRQAVRWTPDISIYVIMSANKSISLSLLSSRFPESSSFWADRVTIVPLENIPVSSLRQRFLSSKIDSSSFLALHFFRDNFWLKAAERLFVLYDALLFLNISEAFHTESDNMLYTNLYKQLPFLRSHYPGLAAPTKGNAAITFGFLYIHRVDGLLDMLQHFLLFPGQNEMHAAHLYEAEYGSSRLGRLPVVPAEALSDPSSEGIFSPFLHAAGGVFDGAPHGQYLGGTNPENVIRDYDFYSKRPGGGLAGFIKTTTCLTNPTSCSIRGP